jgi:hypothetical protein
MAVIYISGYTEDESSVAELTQRVREVLDAR